MGEPQPLLLKPNNTNYDFFLPEDNTGTITFKRKQEIQLACPGSNLILNLTLTNLTTASAICKSDTIFTINGVNLPFSLINCTTYPNHSARYTGNQCEDEYNEIEIGFNIEGKFLRQILLCFDNVTQITLYSRYNLTSTIGGSQTGFPRPRSFIPGPFYNVGKTNLNSIYTRVVQQITINRSLGLAKNSSKYIHSTNSYYLVKGHLTAKTDFVFGSQQLLTFYFVNVAPQWQTLNNGNWATLEANVKNYASNNGLNLEVYTGTYGVTTLPHEETGDQVELYLYVDENNNTALPVPHLFWKFVYEPINKSGAVFVSVNNPYLEQPQAICTDQSNAFSWLTWKNNDTAKGYSYVCEVNEFSKFVKYFPQVQVHSLLT